MTKSVRTLLAACAVFGAMTLSTALNAAAFQTPSTGQPGAPTNTCGASNPVTPGNAANAAGSPFNGAGQAGAVYAGNPNTASLANSNSAAAVSQYDVACVQLSH